jgi:hypothetical protein
MKMLINLLDLIKSCLCSLFEKNFKAGNALRNEFPKLLMPVDWAPKAPANRI